LVDEILFSKGVTTLVAQSGDGKTTFANSVGLTVATGGKWDGKIIKPRPLVWCAGEGQYGGGQAGKGGGFRLYLDTV
jgi:RecA-family ATPase